MALHSLAEVCSSVTLKEKEFSAMQCNISFLCQCLCIAYSFNLCHRLVDDGILFRRIKAWLETDAIEINKVCAKLGNQFFSQESRPRGLLCAKNILYNELYKLTPAMFYLLFSAVCEGHGIALLLRM